MTSAPAIHIRGLCKSYGPLVAVADVDLTVERGEIFAMLGPNGAGKTTTVEILEGYRRRDRGTVSVLGVDPATGDNDWRAQIGIVLQESRFDDELTVRELISHFGSFYADPRGTDELLDAVGLRDKASAKANTLSGGQQRRLDVAIGVVGRPRLLFLDEPTTGFDPDARRQFWELIRQLRAEGTTVLLTTHYLDEAEALADRLAVIASGTIVEIATPATLGGRSDAAAMVHWTDADGVHHHETDAPTAFVAELATRFGGEVPGLAVMRPTLEDVYLTMVHAAAAESSSR